MLPRLAALLCAAAMLVVAPPGGPTTASAAAPTARDHDRGDHPVTELVGQYDHLSTLRPRQVHLSTTRHGYRLRGGGVGNRMVVTEVGGRLRFADTAARRWVNLPDTCRKQRAARGVAALCAIPRQFREGRMFLEIWPRLGHDHVDGHTLPARYRMWVLTDAGDDRIRMGAGADFANGAFDDDVISGGGGDDWVRAGIGSNQVDGGSGDDEIAGGDDRDRIHGGPGRDRVFGGSGNDTLWGDSGPDTIGGGPGRDTAYRDPSDHVSQCEVVR